MSPHSWPGYDLLRFLCILFMVLFHAAFYVTATFGRSTAERAGLLYSVLGTVLPLGLFPLALPFLAGCGLRFRMPPTGGKGGHARPPLRVECIAGAALMGLGIAVNVLSSGWAVWFHWNVLHLVGAATLVLSVLTRWISPVALLAVALALLAATTPLRAGFIPPRPSADASLEEQFEYLEGASAPIGRTLADAFGVTIDEVNGSLPVKVLVGDPAGHQSWPLFPWLSTVIVGYLVAHFLSAREVTGATVVASSVGALALAIAAWWFGFRTPTVDEGHLFTSSVFLADAGFVTGFLGLCVAALLAVSWVARGMTFRRYGIVSSFSRGVLWIYVFHLVAFTNMHSWLARPRAVPTGWSAVLTVENLALIVIWPTAMVLACWLLGASVIRYLHDTRIRLHFRPVARG